MIERMHEKIEARGVRMVSNFVVKTGNKNIEELKKWLINYNERRPHHLWNGLKLQLLSFMKDNR
ncbi:MAG: hypothetical protein ACXVZU_00940 [Methanobacteriaceae archaeon]